MKQKKQQKKQQLKPHFQIVIHSARPKTFNHLHLRKSFSKFRFQPVSTQFYLNYGKRIQVSTCFQQKFPPMKNKIHFTEIFSSHDSLPKIFHWWEEFIHFTEFSNALPPSILLTTQQCKQTQFLTILIDGRLKRKISNKHRQNLVHFWPFWQCRS